MEDRTCVWHGMDTGSADLRSCLDVWRSVQDMESYVAGEDHVVYSSKRTLRKQLEKQHQDVHKSILECLSAVSVRT